MITVHKTGTLGNNMWQYAVSRIIAEKNNLEMDCYSISGFPKTLEKVKGNIFFDPIFKISGHYFEMESIPKNFKIELDGYVQRYEYIKSYKNSVKDWFNLDVSPPIKVLETDFVISIRRGWNGYPVKLCPSKKFFLDIINKVKYSRIILCTDTFDDPFFNFMDFLNVDVIKAKFSPLEQFALIQSANKILLTPSTYCWWAAFLSNASEIYYPWIENMIPTENGVNWFVDDEDRYIVVK